MFWPAKKSWREGKEGEIERERVGKIERVIERVRKTVAGQRRDWKMGE